MVGNLYFCEIFLINFSTFHKILYPATMQAMETTIWQKLYKIFRSSFGAVSVIMVIALWSVGSYYVISYFDYSPTEESGDYIGSSEDVSLDTADCNVVGINLHGDLYTYLPPEDSTGLFDSSNDKASSDAITYYINQADEDEKIKAILLEVDSYGGTPVAAEEIANTLKASAKPTVALIRQAGTSGAYYAATGAQKIYASKLSDIGGIGVTQSYLDNIGKNQKEGLSFVQLSVGKFKDMGNPDKPLTEEEKALIYRDLNITQQAFIEAVSVNRKIPLADVQKIADGSSVMGAKAKELHLIDEIGGIAEVEKYLSEKIGEKAEVCWY